ncbi:pyridoxal phosphate-dependent transferase [Aspergillus pseudocaelatus]|uniref:Pyridoxal phosphate-dependent transferase n=1 Tax=Aspergillus pseudocaelatus TaxID=1825620 RepID=A0ABQ6X2Z4_9EURO|nr:pyridoxal phosphate-dependent transferase [Aspergillus pseudocaelatus]
MTRVDVSSRGLALTAKMPAFFHVLKDLWHPSSNPNGIVNMGLAENSLMHAEMKAFINSQPRADSHALTYGDGFSGSIRLKEALCQFLNRHFVPWKKLSTPQVSITSGASNAIECCAWSLCDPGDHILIGRPYWTTFRTMLGNRASVNVIDVSFGSIDPFSLEAVHCFRRMYEESLREGKNVKAILLCSPNNPLARCYPQEVLEAYMRLCGELGIHLISDELYALSVWENPELENAVPFKSVLSLDVESLMDPKKLHVIWGMSKDFGATGLRIGFLISQSNKEFLNACESISLFSFPSSLADNTVASLLEDETFTDNFIAVNRSRLSENYQHTTKFLKAHGIPYLQSNATLFAWINLGSLVSRRGISDDDILVALQKEKVYITSGTTYASEEPGWFRVVLAHPKEVLDEGLRRILRAVHGI